MFIAFVFASLALFMWAHDAYVNEKIEENMDEMRTMISDRSLKTIHELKKLEDRIDSTRLLFIPKSSLQKNPGSSALS